MIKPLNAATTEKGRLKMLLIDAEALIDEIKKAEQCYRESRMLGSHLYPYKLAFADGACAVADFVVRDVARRWQKMKLGKINRLQIMTDYLIDENIPFEVIFTGRGKPIKIRAGNKYQPWNDGEIQLLPSGQIDSYCGKGKNLFEPDLNVYEACEELKRHYEFDFLKHTEELP